MPLQSGSKALPNQPSPLTPVVAFVSGFSQVFDNGESIFDHSPEITQRGEENFNHFLI